MVDWFVFPLAIPYFLFSYTNVPLKATLSFLCLQQAKSAVLSVEDLLGRLKSLLNIGHDWFPHYPSYAM